MDAATETDDRTQSLAVTAGDVQQAAERLASCVTLTPLQISDRLSASSGAHVYLKREDLQPVRSYKIRGAFNFMLQMSESERSRGVVCASAGNHAQGIARACNELSIHGRIFVPRTTPGQKQSRIKHFGGEWVDLEVAGSTYDDASKLAREYARQTGAMVVSAFDDPRTIAGQGTVAAELLEQLGYAPDVVVVPVGGGGLLAGVAAYLAEKSPATRVVGVEPEGAACMLAALEAGKPVELDNVDPFADGTAVRRAGDVTYGLIRDLGVEVRPVAEGAAASEMLELYQTEGIIAEPSGALASAAIGGPGSGRPVVIQPGETVVCLVSGGNNDIARYGEVLERSLVHEGLKHYFIVDFPQAPGALRRFLDEVLGPEDDIALFDYVKRNGAETGPAFVGVTLGRAEDLDALLRRMEASPLEIERVTPDSPLFRMFA
ncbi:threonine ammonia-lyase IlvA [Sediminivirga luteola]|uniref:L-threonine dehydratase n=1 Tax=Sediminivirga luteola TaxID=1774748 RepID=A0A8J2TXN3_9MICO|nr:threonine ammonia-lyase IlvA [Sediminivirga luteola]MCI2266291.1 threonine ammonia-lyase IlvA [Sediminivirga luteola]GGA12387.1 L-threonine dehydratase [Sediminivirga luteola]